MLRIHQPEYDSLRRHGEESYPNECCGVLLGHLSAGGDGASVVSVVRTGNTCEEGATHNRYQIAPQELIRIQRGARQQGLEIVGFYHSHPDHPAQWSQTDLLGAYWVGCFYVITSVYKDGERCQAQETNAFLLTGSGEQDKHLETRPIAVLKSVAVA
jgi:proteasome lid subunit RPN8/RPN11